MPSSLLVVETVALQPLKWLYFFKRERKRGWGKRCTDKHILMLGQSRSRKEMITMGSLGIPMPAASFVNVTCTISSTIGCVT